MWTFWKTFPMGKNFPGSNATLLPRVFSLCTTTTTTTNTILTTSSTTTTINTTTTTITTTTIPTTTTTTITTTRTPDYRMRRSVAEESGWKSANNWNSRPTLSNSLVIVFVVIGVTLSDYMHFVIFKIISVDLNYYRFVGKNVLFFILFLCCWPIISI